MQISNQIPVNLTGGPLSYRYRFHEIHIHYGLHDQFGSEHSVEGYTFPAEVSSNVKKSFFVSLHLCDDVCYFLPRNFIPLARQ